MTKRTEPLLSAGRVRRAAGVGLFAVLLGAAAAALLTRREAPSAPGQPPDVRPAEPHEVSQHAPAASGLSEPKALDPAAQAEIDRLSLLPRAELVAAAQAASGFSRLLAMNVLWARGEHAAVDQLARASGDRTLVAKARALANRTPGTSGR